MKRQIMERLIEWKATKNKKPLIIKGARQVGKTYIIREFAKTHYNELIEINLERDKRFVEMFQTTHHPNEILEYLKVSFLDKKIDQDALLFIDEIQACSDAITSLKFMSENFPCDVICSGSALGTAIANTSSYPVRYSETWEMFPMSFQEFIEALGVDDSVLQTISSCVEKIEPMNPMLHDKMNELFSAYMVVGGMPEVVKEYVSSKSMKEVLRIQRAIVNDYLIDMVKYTTNTDALKIRECFSSIPMQLAKENQKFQYSAIKKGYNARYFNNSLKWLEDSGLILKMNRLSTIQYPLSAYVELSVFKVFMSDTGLFLSQLDDGDIQKVMSGEMGIYKGAIYENIAAQILRLKHKKAYYYEPSQFSEIDYIIEYNGSIAPVEVKAGKHTESIAFNNYVKKYKPTYAFRFSSKNIGRDETRNIYYFPLYALEFVLNHEKPLF